MPLTHQDDPKDLQRPPFDIEAFTLLAKEEKKKKKKKKEKEKETNAACFSAVL